MRNAEDLIGKKFDRLTVIRREPQTDTTRHEGRPCWLCACDCGKEIVAQSRHLKSGAVRSCGCKRSEDMTGRKFGKLTAIRRAHTPDHAKNKCQRWECLCDCGKTTIVRSGELKKRTTQTCGCGRQPDLTGRRFGRLLVIKRDESKIKPRRDGSRVWECLCDCGKTSRVPTVDLNKGHTQSCGCLGTENRRNATRKPKGEAGFFKYLKGYKDNAKQRGLCFSLTEDEVRNLSQQLCYYCGKRPSRRVTSSAPTQTGKEHSLFIASGIDRVDNDLGYTTENCVACCTTCNTAKMEMSVGEFKAWIARVYERLDSSRIAGVDGIGSPAHHRGTCL